MGWRLSALPPLHSGYFPPGTRTSWREDKAKDPLFTWVSEEALKRPTYKSFISLLDNYETSTGEAEVVTAEEVQENWTFINAIYWDQGVWCV